MLTNSFSNNLPAFFNNFFNDDMLDWTNSNYSDTNTTLPRVNIKETDDEFFIELAAPGMKKEDFNINYENDKLCISSEAKKSDDNEKYTRHEFSYQAFKRTFGVSHKLVDSEKINAKYEDGILCISLPKREEVKPKPAKKIAIA